jgi:gamma-glutamyltranspeptidase/glutathione hydrolase
MPYALGKRVIATQHPLATYVGLKVMENGGNAFDALIAASAVIGVVLPHTSGIGGDAFLLANTPEGKIAYNASGWLPKKASKPSSVYDPNTVLVPGLVDLWDFISIKYCNLDLSDLVRYSIKVAENGFNVSRSLFNASNKVYRPYESWKKKFANLKLGQNLKLKGMAETLRIISKDPREFYEGNLAHELIEGLKVHGVNVELEDFAEFKGEVVKPITSSYSEYMLYELPPNSQGVTTLELLNLIEISNLNKLPIFDPKRIENHVKLALIAYEDRNKYVGDPRFNNINISNLLNKNYLSYKIKNMHELNIQLDPAGDTTFLVASDGENEVGLIQSLFHPFGSGIVVKDIPFNNRGFGFTEGVNSAEPRKRPLHTLSILIAEKEKDLIIIGCAGGDLRPQIHSLVLEYILDYNMEIDQAVDAPRFIVNGNEIIVEGRINYDKGRRTEYYSSEVGIVQALRKKDGEYYIAVADPRSDGIALGI